MEISLSRSMDGNDDLDLESPLVATQQLEESPEEELPEDIETAIRNEISTICIPEKPYVDPRLPSDVSIFRVPNFLKESKREAYIPQIVSLGPYHFNKANLDQMEDHKKRAMRRMMTRFNMNNNRYATNPHDMEFSILAIHEIFLDVEEIKNNYEEKISHSERLSLAVMFTLDGCFMLEILRTLGEDKITCEGSNNYEPIFDAGKIDYTGFDILKDILKLENQIPLLVLRKLLQLEFKFKPVRVRPVNSEQFLFDVLVKCPSTKFYPFDYEEDRDTWSWPTDEQVDHLLGLLHSLIVPAIQIDDSKEKSKDDSKDRSKDSCIPNALELSKAGITFEPRNRGIKNIYFDSKKATIYLPTIYITDYTETLFRNLIAFELCKASENNYFTCYLNLMKNLIGTEKDMAVLKKDGIVKNFFGNDKDAAQLLHDLCKGVTVPVENVFKKMEDEVMKHYRSNWKVWSAQLIMNYFSSPWQFIGLLAAILVVLLTLVQTIFSILSYK